MKKIIVASTNPLKINSALFGFQKMFPREEFSAVGIVSPSNVSDQPTTDEETSLGALNRVNHAMKAITADYWIGIEGGIEENKNEMEAFAWIIIKDKLGRTGKARSGSFALPPKVYKLIKQGIELGYATDQVFKLENSKHNTGAVGVLTENVIDRTELYVHAVVLALVPFKNPNLY
jgi:inosine/xanthosine triphosphatase